MKASQVLKFVVQLMLVVAVLGAAVIGAKKIMEARTPPPKRPRVVARPFVEVTTIAPEDLPVLVTGFATVRAARELEVTAQVGGLAVEVSPNLVAGGFVEEGEVLLRIDPRDFALAVEKADIEIDRAAYEIEKVERERDIAKAEWEELNARRAAPRETPSDEDWIFQGPQMRQARAGLAAAQARRKEAELALSRTTVIAPFTGRVVSEAVTAGQLVAAGRSVALIQAIDAVEVVVPVDDEDLGWLGRFPYEYATEVEGPRAVVEGSYAGKRVRWQGRAVRTEAKVDERSRTTNVVVRVEEPYRAGQAPLVAGAFVEVRLRGVTLQGVFRVPRHAYRDGAIWTYADETLHIRPIEPVRIADDAVYLRDGLRGGEKIVTSRLDVVTDGMKVTATGDALAKGARP